MSKNETKSCRKLKSLQAGVSQTNNWLFIVVASLLISIWSHFADPVINIDAILYFEAVNAYLAEGLQGLYSVYKWPFYPFLIALIHRLLGADITLAAYLLTYVFNVVVCVSFVNCIRLLGGDKKTCFIATLVIVFFSGINELRTFVIRDHGFAAFYLVSIYFSLLFLQRKLCVDACRSILAMLAAALFRIEGLIFLPLIVYVCLDRKQPLVSIYNLVFSGGSLALIFSLFGWWSHVPDNVIDVTTFSLKRILAGWSLLGDETRSKIEFIMYSLVETESDTIARSVYFWTALGTVFTYVLQVLSILYACLAWYALRHQLVFREKHHNSVFIGLVCLHLMMLIVFTMKNLFLTNRYPLALALTILLCVPFSLAFICQKWQSMEIRSFRASWKYLALMVLLIINSYEGFTSITEHGHLKASGLWLQNNTPENTFLFADNQVVVYYSGRQKVHRKIVTDKKQLIDSLYRGEWIHFDYLAIVVPPDPEYQFHLHKSLWLEPIKVFRNTKSSEVRIYNVRRYRERARQK